MRWWGLSASHQGHEAEQHSGQHKGRERCVNVPERNKREQGEGGGGVMPRVVGEGPDSYPYHTHFLSCQTVDGAWTLAGGGTHESIAETKSDMSVSARANRCHCRPRKP